MNVLIISTVWVEPSSSAAGSRMLQLLKIFIEQGWEVVYATTAGVSTYAFDLSQLGVRTVQIQVNDSSFNAFAKACDPKLVLFDRFMSEEQFGWRITEMCPSALKVLDTEDLHCLRKARELAVKQDRDFETGDLISEVAKREIASIYRCDLTLMISNYEMRLLQDFFKVPATLLVYIPFLVPECKGAFKSFEEREHFIAMGNFLHAPNWDATLQLKRFWPLLRKNLPQAELHIYGAYPSDKVMQLHNTRDGFLIKGRAVHAVEVLSNARVLLAPLRFGAGLKGKFIDAMRCGTPAVTTKIGSEAMHQNLPWGGCIVHSDEAFINASTHLYTNRAYWLEAQENGRAIINQNFKKEDYDRVLVTLLQHLYETLKQHRLDNFTGQMLSHHSMRSTMFMSKWIEEKNKE